MWWGLFYESHRHYPGGGSGRWGQLLTGNERPGQGLRGLVVDNGESDEPVRVDRFNAEMRTMEGAGVSLDTVRYVHISMYMQPYREGDGGNGDLAGRRPGGGGLLAEILRTVSVHQYNASSSRKYSSWSGTSVSAILLYL